MSAMKLLAVVALLAFFQAMPPGPRKATDSTTDARQSVQKNATANQTPATASPILVNPVTPNPEQNTSNPPSSKDTEQSIRVRGLPPVSVERNWADWVLWGFSGLLVVVGFFGVRLAYKTLKTIEKQTKATEEAARATGIAAEAALLNAQAVINSERAWIDGEIIQCEQLGIHCYALNVANHGKTPAKLLAYEVRWGYLPEGIPFSSQPLDNKIIEQLNRLIGSNASYRVGDWFRFDQMFLESSKTSGMETGVLCVTISYEDVIAIQGKRVIHKTTFVYYRRPLLDSMERKSIYDDYT